MKTILKLLILCGIIVLTAFSCEKETNEWSDFVEGYVVGSFKCTIDGSNGKLTPRGYCILLANNSSDTAGIMDFYTFNLSDNILNIPQKAFTENYDSRGWGCGPKFFVDSLQTNYKISFRYRYLNENEREKFSCGMCTDMLPMFPWEDYKEISLKDVIKVENNK